MIYTRKHRTEYHQLSLEDIKLFHDIPLIKYTTTRDSQTKIHIKIILIGFHREESISFTIPKFNWHSFPNLELYKDYVYSIMIEACMKKWLLKDPFSYECICKYDCPKIIIRYPEIIGNVIPDWKSAREALKTALRIKTDDKDALFISLYNECLRMDIRNFRSKYKISPNNSATENILKISDIPEEVKNFICKINNPTIERETGNNNKNSFDFIRIRISIPTKNSFPNRGGFVNDNMRYLIYVALSKIESSKRFLRYEIPVTCLSLKKATITCASELELLFELKDELRNMEP